jgi:hypothetical protein
MPIPISPLHPVPKDAMQSLDHDARQSLQMVLDMSEEEI